MRSLEHYQGKDADYVREGERVLRLFSSQYQETVLMFMSQTKAFHQGLRKMRVYAYREMSDRERRCVVIYAARLIQVERVIERLQGEV